VIKLGMCCKVDIGGSSVMPLSILFVTGGMYRVGAEVSLGMVMFLACWGC
jgi:hypothetical protein